MNDYKYDIMLLCDAKETDEVFVPNCSGYEAIEILRFFRKQRTTFPDYSDHSVVTTDVAEDAWCSPKEYFKAFAPKNIACIVRYKNNY